MKSAWARKPIVPLPEPRHRSAIAGSEKAKDQVVVLQRTTTALRVTESRRPATTLGRIVETVASWFMPGSVHDDAPRTPDAREIEALERHIREFTEKHRFTGFPC